MLQGAGHPSREAEVPVKDTRPTVPTDTHATKGASPPRDAHARGRPTVRRAPPPTTTGGRPPGGTAGHEAPPAFPNPPCGELSSREQRPNPRPQDNPFLNNSDYLPEIWALGLRNPFRFSFDPDTGAIWLGDSGQNTWEEIDVMFPGENYGWPNLEGPACYYPPRMCQEFGRLPVFAFNHTAPLLRPASVVIGGHVYRGALSSLRGM
jgi:hypothetical protein